MLEHFFDVKRVFYIAFLLLVLVYTGWLFKQTSSGISTAHTQNNHPDFFVKNIYAVEFNPNGEIYHTLKTPYLLHYPFQDTSYLTTPELLLYSQDRSKQPWNISARKGIARQGTKVINLIDNVIIHEPAGVNNSNLTIRTSELTIYPATNLAQTDKPVTFIEPGIEVHSIGMNAYLKEKRVQLLNQAKGVYDANETKDTPSP